MRFHLSLAALIMAVLGTLAAAPVYAAAFRPSASLPAEPSGEFRYPSLFPLAPTVGTPRRHIEVSLKEQQLAVYEGATPVRAFDVSTGDWQHPTIVGQFSIEKKFAQIDLVGPDYYYHDVPYVMQIRRPFYLHAAPWRSEFGTPVSRGCVTLSTADAAWLFDWAEVGTPVNIHW